MVIPKGYTNSTINIFQKTGISVDGEVEFNHQPIIADCRIQQQEINAGENQPTNFSYIAYIFDKFEVLVGSKATFSVHNKIKELIVKESIYYRDLKGKISYMKLIFE